MTKCDFTQPFNQYIAFRFRCKQKHNLKPNEAFLEWCTSHQFYGRTVDDLASYFDQYLKEKKKEGIDIWKTI